jgi:hypothetical protein
MNWICRLFRHKFRYQEKRVPLQIGSITKKFRKCQRCGLTQKYLNDTGQWIELRKTLSEIRDEKLSKLGIK